MTSFENVLTKGFFLKTKILHSVRQGPLKGAICPGSQLGGGGGGQNTIKVYKITLFYFFWETGGPKGILHRAPKRLGRSWF